MVWPFVSFLCLLIFMLKENVWDLEHMPVVFCLLCLPSMPEALGLVLSTTKDENKLTKNL